MSVRNLLDLSGKTAIVTGGSRGIGLQMATALGEMGAKIALTAHKQNDADDGVQCTQGRSHQHDSRPSGAGTTSTRSARAFSRRR